MRGNAAPEAPAAATMPSGGRQKRQWTPTAKHMFRLELIAAKKAAGLAVRVASQDFWKEVNEQWAAISADPGKRKRYESEAVLRAHEVQASGDQGAPGDFGSHMNPPTSLGASVIKTSRMHAPLSVMRLWVEGKSNFP